MKISRILRLAATISILLLESSVAAQVDNTFESVDVLAVVKVEEVLAEPERIIISTTRVIKGNLPPSLTISSKEWGDDIPDLGGHVLLRLSQSGGRLTVLKRRYFIPAVAHDPNPASTAYSERVIGELSAALRAIDVLVPNRSELEWRRHAVVSELAAAGDAGQAELQRLHVSASGPLRLTYLAGLLQGGDASGITGDMPLLISAAGLSEREGEYIGGSLRSAKNIAAPQAARLLQSASAHFRFNAAYVLRDLAESKKTEFDSEVLGSLAEFGLSDPDSRVRYYSACALTQATQLQSMDAFNANEKRYIEFWKKWLKRGGPTDYSRTAQSATSNAATAGPPPK